MSKKNGVLKTSAEIAMNGGSRFKAAAVPFETVNRTGGYSFSNTLIEASTPQDTRPSLPMVDYDFHRTISSNGRRILYSLARQMFWRIPPLQAAILEQASITACPFIPRHTGSNTAWGENAAEWLDQWGMNMCFEGWPYDYDAYCQILVGEGLVDGEIFTLLTEDASGNAKTQFIPTHRVGSRNQTGGMANVVYDGNRLFIDDVLVDDSLPYTFQSKVQWTAPIVDGAIVDAQMKVIAWRVYEDPQTSAKWRDISARSLFPSFFPMVAGQLRGISVVACSLNDLQDWRAYKTDEQMAQRVFAAQTIVETNESGDADSSAAVIKANPTFNDDGSKSGVAVQTLQNGMYRYMKAKSGSKLEAFDYHDRPGRNSQDFLEMTLRDAMKGTEWDAFFSLDPKSVGGAPMRVIVDRINRVVKKRRRTLRKNIYRVHVYALAKAIKNGDLPFDPEWYKWTYQGSPDLTADRRYDSQVDEMEYERGWQTLSGVAAKRADDWFLNRTQKEKEVIDLYERAQRLVDKFPDMSLQEAANRIELMGASSFSMARRDSGDNALSEDTSTAGKKPAAKPDTKADSEESNPKFRLSIEDKPKQRRREIKFKRDARGVIIGALAIEE